jgi:pumilio RNA-binding family
LKSDAVDYKKKKLIQFIFYYYSQKVLTRCKDHEIYHTLTAEIMENVNKLSADKFGNYVVQQLVEHGGHAMRSTMVRQFAGRVVSMSYHKFASNVVEKCLTFGSQEDRRLIANEIVGAGGGQHFDHLVVGGLHCDRFSFI